MIAEIVDIVFSAVVSEIEVIGLSGIFSCEGIDLLHHGADASLNTVGSDEIGERLGLLLHLIAIEGATDLEITETLLFCKTHEIVGEFLNLVVGFEFA